MGNIVREIGNIGIFRTPTLTGMVQILLVFCHKEWRAQQDSNLRPSD